MLFIFTGMLLVMRDLVTWQVFIINMRKDCFFVCYGFKEESVKNSLSGVNVRVKWKTVSKIFFSFLHNLCGSRNYYPYFSSTTGKISHRTPLPPWKFHFLRYRLIPTSTINCWKPWVYISDLSNRVQHTQLFFDDLIPF